MLIYLTDYLLINLCENFYSKLNLFLKNTSYRKFLGTLASEAKIAAHFQ
jgi:hypothetical protein